jgi:hypothetical protein
MGRGARHYDGSFGAVNRPCLCTGWIDRYGKFWLAGLPSPGDPAFSLRFWYVDAGYSLSPGGCLLGHEVTAHCALWRWLVAMACSHVVEEGSAPVTQEIHDCSNDELVVLRSYLVLYSFNQLIQICRNGGRPLRCMQWRFQYSFHCPSPLLVAVVLCCGYLGDIR